MNRIIVIFVFGLALTLPGYAYDGWSTGTIKNVRLYSDQIYLQQNGSSNPGGCSSSSYIVLEDTNAQYDQFVAALITAASTQMIIQLALTGCSDGGTSGYPLIEQIWLRPDM